MKQFLFFAAIVAGSICAAPQAWALEAAPVDAATQTAAAPVSEPSPAIESGALEIPRQHVIEHAINQAIGAQREAVLQKTAFTPPAPASDASLGSPADWRAIISPEDAARLAALPETRAAAIKDAQMATAIPAKNKSALSAATSTVELLNAAPVMAQDTDLTGAYRCRLTAMGGAAPKLVVRKFAMCSVDQWPNGTLVIEKTSGEERFVGRLWRDADQSFVYLGTSFPAEGPFWTYNERPEENQVGRLYRIGAGKLRLELPMPNAQSALNVIELARTK